jgi:hypothetical protein
MKKYLKGITILSMSKSRVRKVCFRASLFKEFVEDRKLCALGEGVGVLGVETVMKTV